MRATIYVEGGGDSSELHARCREGFQKLFERCGFRGRMPQFVASRGRSTTFDAFKTRQRRANKGDYVAILVDSEDVVANPNRPWSHLKQRDGWTKPKGAHDEQALLMVTCMETWIAADRATLQDHYGAKLQATALPPLDNLESRDRHDVQNALAHGTRNCSNAYRKGKRSFEILSKLHPTVLTQQLPSFARIARILGQRLK